MLKEEFKDMDTEIQEYWADMQATPWHKRRDLEGLMLPPISGWGRAIYYVLMPVLTLAALFSGALLMLVR